jgi:hypothetical protein
MLTAAVAVMIFGGVLALGILMLRWQYRRGEELLEQWARQHSYRVIEREERTAPGDGPMNRYARNKQIVYSVKLVDDTGRIRHARVRIGSPETGVLSERVSVEWDP